MPDLGDVLRGIDSGLLVIEFPDVEIHHEGFGIGLVPIVDFAFDDVMRNLAEIVTAGDRQKLTKTFPGGERKFPQLLVTELMPMDETAPWLGVKVAENRQKAGIVGITFFRQHIQGPEVLGMGKGARATISDYFQTARGFYRMARAGKVFAKLRHTHLAHAAVVKTLTGDFMPAAGNFPNDFRKAFCHPPHNEEGGMGLETVQQVQCFNRVLPHARLEPIPLAGMDIPPESFRMIVVVQANRQNVAFGIGDNWFTHLISPFFRLCVIASFRLMFEGEDFGPNTEWEEVDLLRIFVTQLKILAIRSPECPSHKGGMRPVFHCPLTAVFSSARSRVISRPTITLVPIVTVIGRSVFSRSVMQGMPRYVVSSWIPPESVMTAEARCCNARNSRYGRGSSRENLRRSMPRWPKRCRVLG